MPHRTALILPGQGPRQTGLGVGLYRSDRAFTAAMDTFLNASQFSGGMLRSAWLGRSKDRARDGGRDGEAADRLPVWHSQSLLVALDYAVGHAVISRGIEPHALIGHGAGELAAAALSGVFPAEDLPRLLAARARAVAGSAAGAMLAVAGAVGQLRRHLTGAVVIAAVNSPNQLVLCGPPEDLRRVRARLAADGIASRPLDPRRALHSPQCDKAAKEFEAAFADTALRPPRIPVYSTRTGEPVSAEQACSPEFWAGQLATAVRFRDALTALLEPADHVLLEAGPGTLAAAVRTHPAVQSGRSAYFPLLSAPGAGRDMAMFERALSRVSAPPRRAPDPGPAEETRETQDDGPVSSPEELRLYEEQLKALYNSFAGHFKRAEPRRRVWAYLLDLPRANSQGLRSGQKIASYAGERRTDGIQRLLTRAQWEEEKVRAELLKFVVNTCGANGGTLYLTEVAFPKKGRQAVAVARQYNVEAERVENCQVGIILFYAAESGHIFALDSSLYLPDSWARDPERRAQAGVPEELGYRSKSAIAAELVTRAIEQGVRPDWTVSSLVCPDRQALHQALQRHPHLLAASRGEPAGPIARPAGTAAEGEARSRRRESLVLGTRKFTRTALPWPTAPGFAWTQVATEHRDMLPRSLAHYLCYAGNGSDLGEVAARLERQEDIRAHGTLAKQEIGLGHYEVRSWRGWHRHMTLAMVASTAMELARRPSQ